MSSPRWRLPARVEDLGGLDEVRDRLRDEAAQERVARRLDLLVAIGRARRGLLADAPVGRRKDRVAHPRARGRRGAAGQPQLRRRRPLGLEQRRHVLDRAGDPRHDREAVLGVADRVAQDVGERHRPVVAQQQHPSVERARARRREQPDAGHELEPEPAEVLDRRAGGRRPLAADDVDRLAAGVVEEQRQVAARAVEVRLDDLQREPGRDRGVERVAAQLQRRHPGGGGEPVGRGDHPERARQLRAGGERRLGGHRERAPS